MKEVRTKHRLLPIAMLALALALVVGICGFLVPAPTAHAEEATTPETAWAFTTSKGYQRIETADLDYVWRSTIVVNKTDILTLPNRTAYFGLRVNKFAEWSSFHFLSGLEHWQNVQWTGASSDPKVSIKDIDKQDHFCVKDATEGLTAMRFSLTSGAAIEAFRGWNCEQIANQLCGIELHIGTGEGDDVTYMKVNGNLIMHEKTNDSALDYIRASDFPNGCYLGMHVNLVAGSDEKMYFGEYGTPIVTEVDNTLKTTIDMLNNEPLSADGTFTVRHLAAPDTAVVKLNGAALEKGTDATTGDYHVTAVADDTSAMTYTIHKSLWKKYTTLPKESYITVEDTNGKGVVMLKAQNALPPAWVGESYKETVADADVSYTFTYGSPLTAEKIKVTGGVTMATLETTPLVANTDYTLTAGENDAYTLTIKGEYLAKVTGDYNGRVFRLEIGDEFLAASTYCKPAAKGWITRTNDVTGEVKADDYYTYIPMNRFGESKLAARVYHSEAVDVTKPIFVEFSGLPESGTVWTMFNVAKSLEQMDYFKDGVNAASALQAIFFAGRTDLQKLHGFVETESTNANYTETKQTGNVIELFFGDGTKTGYMKINGEEIGEPTAKQSDFPSKKAYIGWFNANGVTFDFKLNTHLNAIAVDSKDDSGFKMDLADGKDFTVKLVNYAAGDTIVVKNGDTALDASDYSFDAASGNLTIKGTYFGKIPFSKQGVFSVWNDTAKTGTQFTMTYSSSNMKDSAIAFATKGNIADATFTLPAGVTATSVLDANSDPLDSTKFAVSENKVTVRKEAIADKAGVCEFIAIAGKDLYPLYVYVQEFADGAYKTGAGTVTKGNGAIVVDGDVSYMPMQAFNFAEGFQAKVDFKSVPGYFNGGRNFNKTGYVRFSFYDPYSGNTLVFTLYTNYEKDEVTTTDTALYRAYSMTDREGKTVISESLSMVNISQSTNPDPLGAHIVKFAASAGAIEITVDSARTITVSGIGTFNLSASVLTVTTPASAEDAASKVGILFADKDATLDYAAITTEETPIAPEKPAKKRGCGSETGASAMLAGLLLLGAASVVLFVRRREKSAR